MDSLKRCIVMATSLFLVTLLWGCAGPKLATNTSQTGTVKNSLILLEDEAPVTKSLQDFDENAFEFEVYSRVDVNQRVL